MATKYIIRLPWGEESLPSPATLDGIRADIGMAFIDWKKGDSILKGKNPTFTIFTYSNGKKSLSGKVVFLEDYPVWRSNGKTYPFHPNGKIITARQVESALKVVKSKKSSKRRD